MPDKAERTVGGAGDNSRISPSMLSRLRSHDAQAWDRFYRVFSRVLYQWCRKKGLQAADAEDITQDAVLAIPDALKKFDRCRTGDDFRRWLYTITKHRIIDYFRSHDREIPVGLLDDLAQTVGQVESQIENDRLWAIYQHALKIIRPKLEESTWRIFQLINTSHRKAADVADELGIETTAVRKVKWRVNRMLRETIILQTLETIEDEFDDRTWKAFWLPIFDKHEPADVGERLGMSEDGLLEAQSRVLTRLREDLEGLLDLDAVVGKAEAVKMKRLRETVIQVKWKTIKDSFDDRTWKAFRLATFDNRESADVGKELGLTEEEVLDAKARVLTKAREELNGLVDLDAIV